MSGGGGASGHHSAFQACTAVPAEVFYSFTVGGRFLFSAAARFFDLSERILSLLGDSYVLTPRDTMTTPAAVANASLSHSTAR